MVSIIINVVNGVTTLLVVIIFADALLSFFLSPYHPVRAALGSLLAPLLNPIRRVIRPVGMFDFSSLVLIVIIEIVSYVLVSLLTSLR
jgi:YggT family protein